MAKKDNKKDESLNNDDVVVEKETDKSEQQSPVIEKDVVDETREKQNLDALKPDEEEKSEEKAKVVKGEVMGTLKLKLRVRPANDDAAPLRIVPKGDEVIIHEKTSTENFYHVTHGNGPLAEVGYMPKKYVEIFKD